MPRINKKKAKEFAKAIFEAKSLEEAYRLTHPKSSAKSAKANASRMLDNETVLSELDRLMNTDKVMKVNKDILINLLSVVIEGKLRGEEKTADYLRALELLSKLVPEFVDRKAVSEIEKLEEKELDNEIERRFKSLFSEEQPPSNN